MFVRENPERKKKKKRKKIVFKAEQAPKTALLGTSEISRLDAKTQKKQKHHKYHCARLFDIFDSRFFSTLTELAGVTNSKLSERIIKEHNNELFSEKDSIKNV